MRHPLDFFDPGTGEPLTAVERRARVDEAWRDRKEADIIDVWENTCHDGSGSITTERSPSSPIAIVVRNTEFEQKWSERTWTVLSGTGAYIGMSGSGTLSVQRSPSGAAESMYVVAEVDL